MTTTHTMPVAPTAGYSPSMFGQGFREAVIVTEAIRSYIHRNQDNFHYQYASRGETIDVYPALTFTPAMMTQALSGLDITPERLVELGLSEFMEPCKLQSDDHTGCGRTKHVRFSDTLQWVPI